MLIWIYNTDGKAYIAQKFDTSVKGRTWFY